MERRYTLGSLGSEAWVDNPHRLLDYTVSHFLLSNYSQSYNAFGGVRSFSWLLETYAKDLSSLKNQVTITLSSYLSEHFQTAEVEVQINDSDMSAIAMTLFIECVDMYGVKTNLNWLLRTSNNKLSEIIEYNNYGEQKHVVLYP